MSLYTETVSNTINDGYESVGGNDWDNSDCVAGFYGLSGLSRDYITVGRFFPTVPQGSTISSATWNLWCTNDPGTGPFLMRAAAEAADNPAIADTGSHKADGWTMTTAHTDYNASPGSNANIAIDITSIVQEIVNRGGWSSGNAMNLRWRNNGMSGVANLLMNLWDLSAGATHPQNISITYTAGGGGGGRTFFVRPGLDGHSSAGPKQFNPALT